MKAALLTLMILILGCGIPLGAPVTALQATVTIPVGASSLMGAAYGTNPLVVQFGTRVTWINNDTMPHTATSNTGVWDSGDIAPGGSWAYTFNQLGTFPYHCTIHGAVAMSGTIVVNP